MRAQAHNTPQALQPSHATDTGSAMGTSMDDLLLFFNIRSCCFFSLSDCSRDKTVHVLWGEPETMEEVKSARTDAESECCAGV